MEFKNSIHSLETLQKIKNYLEELKKDVKTCKKAIKETLKMNYISIYEKEEILEPYYNRLNENLKFIGILKENLRHKKDIINLYIDYNHKENFNNLPLSIENILIENIITYDKNIDNLPITLKNFIHRTIYDKEDENKLKLPFDCNYNTLKRGYFYKSDLKKYKIDTKNIYQILFYKDLQLYKKLSFCGYYEEQVLNVECFSNDFY